MDVRSQPSGSSRKPQHEALGARFAEGQREGRLPRRSRTPCARGCQSTRCFGIEWIQIAACDGGRLPAGAEIVRLNVGARSRELDGPPLPPSALVAAIGLLIGEPLAQRFEETTEPGRKNPG